MPNPKIAEVTPEAMVRTLRVAHRGVVDLSNSLNAAKGVRGGHIDSANGCTFWLWWCAIFPAIWLISDIFGDGDKTSPTSYVVMAVFFLLNWLLARWHVEGARRAARVSGRLRVRLQKSEDRFEDEVKFHERFWGDVFQAINERKVK